MHTGFWWGNLRERDYLQDPGVDVWITLDGTSGRGLLGHGMDGSGSGYGQLASICDCGNEPSGLTQFGELLDLAENWLASQERLCSTQ